MENCECNSVSLLLRGYVKSPSMSKSNMLKAAHTQVGRKVLTIYFQNA